MSCIHCNLDEEATAEITYAPPRELDMHTLHKEVEHVKVCLTALALALWVLAVGLVGLWLRVPKH